VIRIFIRDDTCPDKRLAALEAALATGDKVEEVNIEAEVNVRQISKRAWRDEQWADAYAAMLAWEPKSPGDRPPPIVMEE